MIVPLAVVVVGISLVVGEVANSGSAAKAPGSRKAIPIPLVKKSSAGNIRKAAISPDTTYVSTGWVITNTYEGEGCSAGLNAEGYNINRCFVENGAGYMYQLTGGSCTGAVRQDFSDEGCHTLIETTPLDDTAGCVYDSVSGYSSQLVCTVAEYPETPFQSIIATYFRAGDCITEISYAASFSAVATNQCIDGYKMQCSGSSGTLYQYDEPDCSGSSISEAETLGACLSPDDDGTTDDAYFPGSTAETMTRTCYGTANDAASLVNSLGAKAVLAIVLSVVTYLAF